MKRLEITITFELPQHINILLLLRAIEYFFWAGIMQRSGGKIQHKIYDSEHITMDLIHETVSNMTMLSKDQIILKSRKREIVQARQICMKLSHDMIKPKPSLSTIGMHFGEKDHATVLHACKTIDNLLYTDKKFSRKFDEIKKAII